MTDSMHSDLINHMTRQFGLNQSDAERAIDEVMAYFKESPEDFIRRRHRELQLLGHNNTAIYAALKTELEDRVFPSPSFSERQIRRMVYG